MIASSVAYELERYLIPIDGSEYSLDAAKYAIRIAKDEKAQLFCIHVITPQIPYGYGDAWILDGQYYEDIKDKVESWFDKVKDMAKAEDIADVKTEIFIDVKSVIESVIDYASRRNIDLIVIGTRGRTGLKRFFNGKRSKWRCTACSLSCFTLLNT